MIRLHYLAFIALLIASIGNILLPNVSLAAGEPFCQSQYHDANGPEFKACLQGYQYGDPSNPICGRMFQLPVGNVQPKQLQDACVAGWLTYKQDSQNCGNDAACKTALRPAGPSLTQGTPPGNLSNPAQPGPVPSSADVGTLKSDTDVEHYTCGIEGFFGNLVCAISNTAARIADTSFSLLSIFLKTPPLEPMTTNTNNHVYNTWQQFRNLANFVFVIGFLVMIYSQLTGVGISNYNIKKILPRIIVAALLINISYFICALAVDLSNFLGGTLTDVMGAMVPPAVKNGGGLSTWSDIMGSSLLLTGGLIAAGAGVLFLDLAMIIPVLATVVIVIVTTVVLLIVRQALIIIFIIISPLAMAAIILPGTHSWFSKWKSLFIPLLMLYPSVAFVYGASQIAAQVLQSVGDSKNSVILSVASLGVQIIPLALTPTLMKLGGGLLSRYAGVVQGSTPAGKIKKKADEYAKYRGNLRQAKALGRDPKSVGKIRGIRDKALGRKVSREASRKALDEAHKGTLEDAAIETMEDTSVSRTERAKQAASRYTGGSYQAKTASEKYQSYMANSGSNDAMSRAKAYTIHQKAKAHAKKVKAQALAWERGAVAGEALTEAASKGTINGKQISKIQQEAAILRIGQMGDVAGTIAVMQNSGDLTHEQRHTLATSMQSKGAIAKAPFLGNATAVDNLMKGVITAENFSQTVVAPSIAEDDYTAQSMTTLDGNGADAILAALANPPTADQLNSGEDADDSRATVVSFSSQDATDIQQAAFEALKEGRTDAAITGARSQLEILADGYLDDANLHNYLHTREEEARDLARGNYSTAVHEEALMQDRLFEMEHGRAEEARDRARGDYSRSVHEEAIVQDKLHDMEKKDEPYDPFA